MLIPLGTELPTRRTPVVTAALLALTVAAYLLLSILSRYNPELAADALALLQLNPPPHFRWWGLFTCTLLHGGLIHLAGNMFFLWTFGPAVEDRFGRPAFLAFYLAGAAASSAAHALLESAPAIGASGAIAAVTGAFLVLFPFTRVRCLWIFGLSVIHPPAWWLIGLGILWNLFAQGFGADRGVAHLAHLAGYAFGTALAMLLLWLRVFPRQPYDLFTFFRQAHRRRQLRAATAAHNTVTRPEHALARADESLDAIAAARARVSTLVAQRRLDDAADAYRDLIHSFPHRPELLTLSRNAQYELAIHLFRAARFPEAADAFARFLDLYPADREADDIRMLLARTYLTRLDRPADAQPLLASLAQHAAHEDTRAFAHAQLARLQRAPTQE